MGKNTLTQIVAPLATVAVLAWGGSKLLKPAEAPKPNYASTNYTSPFVHDGVPASHLAIVIGVNYPDPSYIRAPGVWHPDDMKGLTLEQKEEHVRQLKFQSDLDMIRAEGTEATRALAKKGLEFVYKLIEEDWKGTWKGTHHKQNKYQKRKMRSWR